MRKVLQPLLHKDSYTAQVEQPLISWFWEAVFGPLFQLLEEADVQTKAKDQAIGRTPELKNGENGWNLFPANLRSLRVKRVDMPQVRAADRPALALFLATRGIPTTEGTILPHELRPTQEGYWQDRLEEAQAHQGTDREILISQDFFILDGHHQWLASLARPERPVQVTQYMAPIRQLIRVAANYQGVRFKNAAPGQTVADALRSGRIHWADGKITGEFTAAISRQLRELGATFDSGTRTFSLPIERVPMELRTAVAESAAKSQQLHKDIAQTLKSMESTVPVAPTGLSLRKAVDKITADLQKQFERTLPTVASISVQAHITPEMRAAITTSLTENLDLSIKNFASEQIPALRRMVEENALQGARSATLARIIEARYGVAKRKARFLGDTETSLIVSKYREERYKRIGSRQYKWSTSHDERVRPGHVALNGTIQSWDSPPIDDPATGGRHNPGEAYRCRCVALPILDLTPAEPVSA